MLIHLPTKFLLEFNIQFHAARIVHNGFISPPFSADINLELNCFIYI